MTSHAVRDLERWFSESPTDVAIRTPTSALTVADVCDRVSAMVGELRAARVKPGDVIAIAAHGADEAIALIAVQAAGGVSVVTPSEHEYRSSAAQRLFHDSRTWAPSNSIAMGAQRARVNREWMSDIPVDGKRRVHGCLTSGTTGEPKVVWFSASTARERTLGYCTLWPVSRTASLFGLSSVAGLAALNAALHSREPYLVIGPVDEHVLTLLASDNVRHLCGAPNQVAQLVGVARGATISLTVDSILTAGAPQTPQFIAAARSICSGVISNVYGSTEGGTVAYSEVEAAAAFVGRPVLGAEFQAVDEVRVPVPNGTEGDIRYRTTALCETYSISGIHSPITDADGWFYPGDRGLIDNDGTITVTGRASDIINIGGVKVNPLPIESDVESIDGVRDAACVPITVSDGTTHLVLAIVAANSAARVEVIRLIESRGPIGQPNLVIDVPSIPRNRNGKIDRSTLERTLSKAIRIEWPSAGR